MRKVSKTRKKYENEYAKMLGNRLRTLRKAAGLTQREMASFMCMGEYGDRIISLQENGKVMPTIRSLLRYSDYYHVPIDIFFCDEADYITAFRERFKSVPPNCSIVLYR